MSKRGFSVVFACAALVPSPVRCEEIVFDDLDTDIAKLDLQVPEAPAFVALGLNPEDVTRPASPRELAAALLSGIDKEGNFQTGLAIDTVPYLTLFGPDLTIRDYKEEDEAGSLTFRAWRTQALSHFQTSVATTKGTTDDDESLRLATGFRQTLWWNRADPRLDQRLSECLATVTIPDPVRGEPRTDWKVRVRRAAEAAEPRVEVCQKESEQRLWNATSMDVGIAPTWISKTGATDDVGWDGATAWGSFGYGFEDDWIPDRFAAALRRNAQFITHARYRLHELVARTDATGFVRQDSVLWGARFRFGRPRFAVSAEASWLYEDAERSDPNSALKVGVDVDLRLVDQVWLLVGVGTTAGRSGSDMVFVNASLRWGGQQFSLADVLADSIATN